MYTAMWHKIPHIKYEEYESSFDRYRDLCSIIH